MLSSLTLELPVGGRADEKSAKVVIGRLSGFARGTLRWVAYLPYFKITSGLFFAEALGALAVILIGLSYAVLCHSIRDCLARHSTTQRETIASIKGAGALFVLLNVAVPIIAFVFSPASFGTFIETPHELLPAFAILVAPCCVGFGVAQRHRLTHARLLSRLGLTAPQP